MNQFRWQEAVARVLPFSFGKIFIVLNSADAWASDMLNKFGPDSDGVVRAYTSVAAAYDAMVSNRNDVMILDSSSTHALTSMLTVSKNRCHFIGLDWLMGIKRSYGQRTKISLGVTGVATNIGTINNLGIGNSYHGIKVMNSDTVAQSLYSFIDGGEYAYFEDCEFYKETMLDQTGAAEFVWNGDSTTMKNCTIGSLANSIAGSSIIRPCVLLTAGIAGAGKVCRDGLIENTLFWRQCKDTSNVFIRAANANDVERQLLLKGCGFINNLAAANKPAVCIGLGATLTTGNIVLDPTCYASNVTKVATATGVIVTGAAVDAGAGIGVNAA